MKYKYKGLFKLLLIVSILSINFTCYAEPANDGNNAANKVPGVFVDKNHDNIPDDQQGDVQLCDDKCLANRYNISVERDMQNKKFYIKASKGKFTMFVIRKSVYYINGQTRNAFSMQPIIMDFDADPSSKAVNFYITEESKNHDLEIVLLLVSDIPGDASLDNQSKLLIKYNALLGGNNGQMEIIRSNLGQYFDKAYNSSYIFATNALIYAPSVTNYTKNEKLAGLCHAFVNGVSWDAFPNYNDIKNNESFHKLYEKYKPNGTATDNNFFRNVIPYCYESKSKLDVNLDTLYQMMLAALNMKRAVIGNSVSLPPVNPNDYDKVFDLTNKSEGPDIVGSNGLKCDYDLKTFKNNKSLFDEYLNNPKKYPYVNTNKYYASKVTYSPYQLRYSKKNLSCERTCSEKLTVSYGAPIASKAGVCFEYKVKVHSKVECSSKFTGEVPKPSDYPLCNPTPACWHAAGNWVGTAGGPNEQFDMCITKCDGGKYTKKCSNYCYDNVYGGKDTANKNFIDMAVNHNGGYGSCKDAAGYRRPNGTGYYAWSGDDIVWKRGEGANHWDTYSRFYFQNGRGSGTVFNDYRCGDRSGGGSPFVSSTNGFKLIFVNGWICDADCTYTGCPKGSYLNQNDVLGILYLDLKDFNTKVDECTAATTCAEKTAEFTMTVNYDTNKKAKDKLTYPFTYSDERYTPSVDQLSTWRDRSDKNTSSVESSTIRSYDYCYYKDSHSDDEYEIEWSFGGTWMHRKTGNISYKKPASSREYYLLKGKYCLPKNVKHVNSNWWAIYDKYKTASNNGSDYTPTTSEMNAVRNELNGNASRSDGYNINGKMRNFGYFGWDLDINCFYALANPNSPTVCEDGKCPPPAHPDNFIIRPVSNKNLFPNDDREIGYNWRLDDNVVEGYNKVMYGEEFDIERSRDLINSISNKNQISEENLDYRFNLSPTDLRNIKKDKKVFGDWVHAGGLFNSYGEPDAAGKIREPQIIYYTSDLVTRYSDRRPEHGNKKLGGDN